MPAQTISKYIHSLFSNVSTFLEMTRVAEVDADSPVAVHAISNLFLISYRHRKRL